MMDQYQVSGMTCSSCVSHVEKAVAAQPYVKKVEVSLLTNSMRVETNDGQKHESELLACVHKAGYDAAPAGHKATSTQQDAKPAEDPSKPLFRRLCWSLGFLIPLMYLSMEHMIGWPVPKILSMHAYPLNNALTQLLLTIPVILIDRAFFIVGGKRLWQRSPNMDSLIAVGSGASFLYALVTVYRMATLIADGNAMDAMQLPLYFESSAMILTLITLGKFFEARAKKKTTSEIDKLLRLAPDEVTVLSEGKEVVTQTSELKPGDKLLIHPGERIPVDGTLDEGTITLDQTHITGESMPVEKRAGDLIISGSMNKVSSFTMTATKVGQNTTLSKIIELVREAGDAKAPIAKLADKVSGVFVPVVMAIAAITLIIWMLAGQAFSFALSCAVAVLVISCPCALGLATPVAIMVGTGVGAKHGILFRNGEVLETLHNVTDLVLDKTGTLTNGLMTVQKVAPTGRTTKKRLSTLALQLEKGSEHPLADAVMRYAKEQGIEAERAKTVEAIPGRGLKGEVEGKTVYTGNPALMQDIKVSLPDDIVGAVNEAADQGMSILLFADEGGLLGYMTASDKLKPDSAQAIQSVKALGVTPHMMTGDQERAARYIASLAGIDHVMAQVMPADKADQVKALQSMGKRVAMVGDGINDAPALKQADVGVAIGNGTDIAIETADVVLASGKLSDVPTAMRLSGRVILTIKENLFWAFFYNVVGIPIAAGALYPAFGITLSPMLGAAAMSLSSVCVVANALRLRGFRTASKTKRIKEGGKMNKIITIEGMHCNHCKASVEKVLGALDGVTKAVVDLEKKQASVEMSAEVDPALIKDVIDEAGFKVTDIR